MLGKVASCPVPPPRRNPVNASSLPAPNMGKSVLSETSQETHHRSLIPTPKAMNTPELQRQNLQMSPSSPAQYAGHTRHRSPPVVRPQSAMGLMPPPNSSGHINYSNSYAKAQNRRPPSSLGLSWSHGHVKTRSFGDGVTSENIYSDGVPPAHDSFNSYSATASKLNQNQNRSPVFERAGHQSPSVGRAPPTIPRGSYNPHYASGLDLNSRTNTQRETMANSTSNHVSIQPDLGNPNMARRAAPDHNMNQDLRSAWHRLYGHGVDASSRRPSVDFNATSTNQPFKAEATANQVSPRLESRASLSRRDNLQSPSLQTVPRDRQVAGPMVTPYLNSERQSPTGQCSPHLPASSGQSPLYSRAASYSSPKLDVKNRQSPQNALSLGPASKYPSTDMGLRTFGDIHESATTLMQVQEQHIQSQKMKKVNKKDNLENKERQSSSCFTQNHAFCSDSENEYDDGPDILPTDSIFDYPEDLDNEDNVTSYMSLKGRHPTLKNSLNKHHTTNVAQDRNVVSLNLKEVRKSVDKHQELKPSNYARSRSLEDLRESGDESNMSFDIENTFLMVDPSDQSEIGTLRSKNSDVKTKMKRLEGMYDKVMKTLEGRGPTEPRVRRWSIGSSDTNSVRHQVHRSKHGRNQRMGGQDTKSVNKRFQRLESHVITLARSIAHISSELRTQTTMSREIENVKREIEELKISGNNTHTTDRKRYDFDKYRGYNHPLTNPKQVKKLTSFFGQEPSWLEIFLTQLGYKQYVKNFGQEHIGMMELPYMTHEQLKSIGIPMGPRTRILQESQRCFKDDGFSIYIV